MNFDNGFWIGHNMLGDVIGFCAAAHLLSDKLGIKIKVNFQESRKDAVNYFDGVVWVPRSDIPNAIDCGGNPSIEEWPKSNGVKRFYKWMDPSLTPNKSFDIHMNCERIKSSEKIIGLITHANTQGDIPDHIIKKMIEDAKREYPDHSIVLFGNKDNKKIDNVIDLRQDTGDINWIVNFMKKLDLLITPQSGPCFIAAGLKIPMWVYKSREEYWDYVLNYDMYKVEKWYDRERNILYINWKTGLGDCILHISSYYYYAKKYNKKVYWYANTEIAESKSLELINVYEKTNSDIKDYLICVPFSTIRKNGTENFGDFIPVPSDNCHREYWKNNKADRFIHKFTKVLNFDNKIADYKNMPFKAEYIPYKTTKVSSCNYVTVQLCGLTSGSWNTNYHITKEQIVELCQKMVNLGYHIKLFGPFDYLCKELCSDAHITMEPESTIESLFDVLSNSKLHIGVDSGIAHVALSCGVPYFSFKTITPPDLGFGSKDCINVLSDNKNYGICKYDIGNILCTINLIENIGIETGEMGFLHIPDDEDQIKFRIIFENIKTRYIVPKYSLTTVEPVEFFPDLDRNSSWLCQWNDRNELTKRRGHEYIIPIETLVKVKNRIGMCFSSSSSSNNILDKNYIRKVLEKNIVQAEVFYYSLIDDDQYVWIKDEFGDKITIIKDDLRTLIKSILQCDKFIGSDNELSWIPTFAKIETVIVIGHSNGNNYSKSFEEIPWVSIEWENALCTEEQKMCIAELKSTKFKVLEENVTLVCVDCVDVNRAIKVLELSSSVIKFKHIKIFTSEETSYENAVKIDKISSRSEYSRFCVYELSKYIETTHCLIVQHDGWICNPEMWEDYWLNYDYIGGLSNWTEPEGKSGNGGFSLRSKKLLEAGKNIIRNYHPEDVAYSGNELKGGYRKEFEMIGFRFAPHDIMCKFSIEGWWTNQFGHHLANRNKNLNVISFSSNDIISAIYGSLENRTDVTYKTKNFNYFIINDDTFGIDKTTESNKKLIINSHSGVYEIPEGNIVSISTANSENKNKPKVYDCFMFFNEIDLLTLRLHEMCDITDKFIIIEADRTHSGTKKESIYLKNKEKFSKFADKIIHRICQLPDSNSSPYNNECIQRNYIKTVLGELDINADDLIIISDVDEIPERKLLLKNLNMPYLYKIVGMNQYKFNYKLNLLETVGWNYSFYCTYSNIPMDLNKTRFGSKNKYVKCGWHFSYLGGEDLVIEKIKSFHHQEYNNEESINKIKANMKTNTFFVNNTQLKLLKIDVNFPEYLIYNKEIFENYIEY
jgi:beta-1,4-mannosyl-glycoprotein beta-1,4-N-acetylglucosaminyltransferase